MRKFRLSQAIGLTLKNVWKILDYWYVFLLYAGILTLISLLFRRWSYSCLKASPHNWCFVYPNNTIEVYAYLTIYYICVCFIVFSFGYDVYNAAFNHIKFKLKNILAFNKERLKCIGFYFVSITLWMAPVMLAFYIFIRPAIPDFATEFGLFLVVFSCMVFSLLYIRVSAFIGYYLNNLKMPSLSKIFKATSGRAYVSIVLFLVMLLIVCVIQLRTIGSLTKLNEEDTFLMTILAEYIDYVIKLFVFGLFLSSFRAQADLLQQEEVSTIDDETSDLSQDNIEEEIYEKKATVKSKTKKTIKRTVSKTTKKVSAKKTANTRGKKAKKTLS